MGIFKSNHDSDEIPAELLDRIPGDMQNKWAFVSKSALYQVAFVGFLFGVGTAASVIGYLHGPASLQFGFPIAFLLSWLMAWLRKGVEERQIKEFVESCQRSNRGKPNGPQT
jgi:hypothetical protein